MNEYLITFVTILLSIVTTFLLVNYVGLSSELQGLVFGVVFIAILVGLMFVIKNANHTFPAYCDLCGEINEPDKESIKKMGTRIGKDIEKDDLYVCQNCGFHSIIRFLPETEKECKEYDEVSFDHEQLEEVHDVSTEALDLPPSQRAEAISDFFYLFGGESFEYKKKLLDFYKQMPITKEILDERSILIQTWLHQEFDQEMMEEWKELLINITDKQLNDTIALTSKLSKEKEPVLEQKKEKLIELSKNHSIL